MLRNNTLLQIYTYYSEISQNIARLLQIIINDVTNFQFSLSRYVFLQSKLQLILLSEWA